MEIEGVQRTSIACGIATSVLKLYYCTVRHLSNSSRTLNLLDKQHDHSIPHISMRICLTKEIIPVHMLDTGLSGSPAEELHWYPVS